MNVALAYRRVDPADTRVPISPESEVGPTRIGNHEFFRDVGATVLVGSGAREADPRAMDFVGELSLRRVALPSDRSRFHVTSLSDRPYGEAGLLDSVVAEPGLLTIRAKLPPIDNWGLHLAHAAK